MRPVLDQPAIHAAGAVRGDAVEQRRVVGTETREQRHVVGAAEHVHRVQLQQSQAPDRPGDRRQARLLASGPGAGGKALGGQRDAPRGLRAQPHARSGSSGERARP